MIVKMKKITLLVTEKERDRFLSALRRAGAVHVSPVREPIAQSLEDAGKSAEKAEKAVSALMGYVDGVSPKEKKWVEKQYIEKAEKVLDAFYSIKHMEKEIRAVRDEREQFKILGEFDPAEIATLKDKGVNIQLYRVGKKHYRQVKDKETYLTAGQGREHVYVCTVNGQIPEDPAFAAVSLPSGTSKDLEKKIEKIEHEIKKKERYLEEEAAEIDNFRKLNKVMNGHKKFLEVKSGMGEEEKFSYLNGYCPDKELDKITALADKNGAGYVVSDPDDPQEVPTLIENPKWISIIDPVFKFMNTIPGYDEFDISFVFLIFFSLFFAMLVGDAGYGLLFLGMTFLGRKLLRNAPPAPFFLMYLLSGATILWGAASGTWFGSESIARLPFFSSVIVDKISSFGADNQQFMMYLSFTIGVIHLTIAHLKKALRVINSPLAIAQAGWIFILWGMFFAAGTLVVGKVFPPFAGYLLGLGILMVLFFENYQKNILKGAGQTLTSLPLNVISSFSDIVSYLRLFAVGYATVIVAESFNGMAIGGGIKSFTGGLIAAAILFVGHALNIVLAIMAVVVHGIRLNVLEFSGHLGMQWTGEEYAPFREQ